MRHVRVINWKERLHASGVHLGVSLLIAALAAWLVFAVWYPYPYRDISGGRELFFIVISVDVLLGPLITFAIFNRSKPRTELFRDLGFVGLIQLIALAYGLWTVCVARPVYLVFDLDRFQVIHAVDVPEELLQQAPEALRTLPLTGPTLLALRPFKNADEQGRATMMALQGLHLGAQPYLWQDYQAARERVLAAAKPVEELRQRFPQQTHLIDAVVKKAGTPDGGLRYLPMVGRKSFWTVLLDAKTAEIRGFVPLDSF